MNAYLGGTLYQDLPVQHSSDICHHETPPYDEPVHKVNILKDSGLYRLLKLESLAVNSYHHQAVKVRSDRLKTMAVSEDGIIEAVEMPGKKFV